MKWHPDKHVSFIRKAEERKRYHGIALHCNATQRNATCTFETRKDTLMSICCKHDGTRPEKWPRPRRRRSFS